MAKKFPQPKLFRPKNPQKYMGNVANIVLRSNLEKRFALWVDSKDEIRSWGSEEITIPYLSPVDNQVHRYFPDFIMVTSSGKKYIVEIKPYQQCVPPTPPKKLTKKTHERMITESMTYAVNQAKWKAASAYAKTINAEFVVITEQDLS